MVVRERGDREGGREVVRTRLAEILTSRGPGDASLYTRRSSGSSGDRAGLTGDLGRQSPEDGGLLVLPGGLQFLG